MLTNSTTTDLSLRGWLAARSASERETLARLWALPAELGQPGTLPEALADALLQPAALQRVLQSLNERERAALERLLAEERAMLPAAVVEREYGSVRAHENYPNPRAYLLALQQPPSPTERLYTLGLILQRGQGNQRSYYVPSDLRPLLPKVPTRDQRLHLTPMAEPPQSYAAHTLELERNVVTILTLAQAGELQVIPTGGLNKASLVRLARRWGQSRDDLQGVTHERHWPYVHFLRAVLEGAGLLRVSTRQELLPSESAAAWLAQPQLERIRRLVDGWVESSWDELVSFVGVQFKSYAFGRNLAATRRAILALLAQVPPGVWIGWDDMIDAVQRTTPDFARPDGRYDTWHLRSYRGEDLDGYEHWHEVEGEQLRSTIGGSLRWLGLTDYGGTKGSEGSDDEAQPLGFQVNALGAALLGSGPPSPEPAYAPLVVQGTFELLVPAHAAPAARFLAARCAKLLGGEEVERYQLTKESIQAAVAAGLSARAIGDGLAEAAGGELPPNVAYSLREWAGQYGQLTLQHGALLRADDPLLLEQIRRDKRLRWPEYEALSADTLLLSEGHAAELGRQLRKAGYGLAGDLEGGASQALKEHDLTLLFAALEFYQAACAELEVQSEAGQALRQRLARLLNQRQHQRAERVRAEALAVLRKRLTIRD